MVIVDTAGRLHTKTGLMDELGKVKRVVEKQAAVDEVLLVLDATTGQNGMQQARVFAEVVDVTGIVLTKLDGTAKGGIVVQVQRELGVPVKLVGLGEGADDLAPVRARGVRRRHHRRTEVPPEPAEIRHVQVLETARKHGAAGFHTGETRSPPCETAAPAVLCEQSRSRASEGLSQRLNID